MRTTFFLLSVLFASPSFAQHSHVDGTHSLIAPKEGGQSAFSAITEIVSILTTDPDTDWNSVDISALQRHLVDMDLLTTQADVKIVELQNGARFEVQGKQRVLEAIRAMIPAHAPFLANESGWDVSTEIIEDGVALIAEGEKSQIQALGFFGLMAIGAHHQEHHLMLARGAEPH
jgi:hypothetical protein